MHRRLGTCTPTKHTCLADDTTAHTGTHHQREHEQKQGFDAHSRYLDSGWETITVMREHAPFVRKQRQRILESGREWNRATLGAFNDHVPCRLSCERRACD